MRHPSVRSAILSDYASLARAVGLDPQAMLKAAGIAARSLNQPDLRLRVGKVSELLERSAVLSGTPDFGLRLSKTRSLASLGALGALMRDEPTVRDALKRSVGSAHLNSSALWMQLTELPGLAIVQLALDADGQTQMRQAHEMALGGLMRVLQHLLGAGWRPREVHFMHEPGPVPRTYREVFGAMPVFTSGFNALVLETADLDRPIPLSDARLRQYAPAALAAHFDSRARISPQTVRHQVMTLLASGRCSASAVASALGVDRRTLNRHLRAEGRSYLQVANEVRLEQARQALRGGRRDASRTAEMLGFSSLSAFSRWFRRQTGQAPSAWQGGTRRA